MSGASEKQTSLPWISSAEDSHARISRAQGEAPASTAHAAPSGSNTAASSKSSARASSSSRTSRRSLREGWTSLSPASTRSATACTAASSPPPTSARRTDVNGSSSWRTPLASDDRKGDARKRLRKRPDLDGLLAQVRHWPTPVTTDAASAARASTTTGVMHPGLSLTDAIRMWPTPSASDYGSSGNGCPGDGREAYAHAGTPSLSTTARAEGGTLNSDWVEALRGYPIGWTEGPLDPATLLLFGSLREP